jgi:Protein of unknown function (DUF983)
MATILKKGTKMYSMFEHKCPRCHEGDLYPTKTFSFKKSFDMHKNCPQCGLKYELEPGFFWGSMYVSYALSGGWMLGSFAVLFFLFGIHPLVSIGLAAIGVFIWYIWIFRTARSIWLNLFISYKPSSI